MPIRILVVDDEPVMRRAVARELRTYEVLQSASCDEALQLLEQSKDVHAVLSDCLLGNGPDGLELLGEVRHRFPHCARLLMSATFTANLFEAFDSELASHFIEKPWREGTILFAIKEALNGQRGSLERPPPLRER